MTKEQINDYLAKCAKFDQSLTIHTDNGDIHFDAYDTDPIIYVIRGVLKEKLKEMERANHALH